MFTRQTDALAAVKRYNNVQLDGKPMKIEIVGTNISTPASAPPPANAVFGNAYRRLAFEKLLMRLHKSYMIS